MTRPHPSPKQTRKCADCPAVIPAYGNRKRCVDCQDLAYKTRKNGKGRPQTKPQEDKWLS